MENLISSKQASDERPDQSDKSQPKATTRMTRSPNPDLYFPRAYYEEHKIYNDAKIEQENLETKYRRRRRELRDMEEKTYIPDMYEKKENRLYKYSSFRQDPLSKYHFAKFNFDDDGVIIGDKGSAPIYFPKHHQELYKLSASLEDKAYELVPISSRNVYELCRLANTRLGTPYAEWSPSKNFQWFNRLPF